MEPSQAVQHAPCPSMLDWLQQFAWSIMVECKALSWVEQQGRAQSNMVCLQATDSLYSYPLPILAFLLLAAPQLGPQARVGNVALSDWQQDGHEKPA